MSPVLKATAALDLVAVALVFQQTGVDARLGAFAFGMALFGANLLLVVFVARRLFASAGQGAPRRNGRASPLLVLALFIKVMVLGAGAWVAIRVAGFDPLFFLAGLVVSLVFFVASATALRRHFSLSTDPKVR